MRILFSDSYPTIKPRNGGCAPRIVCEPVLIDRSLGDNIIPYPQCLEIHRCGGCCQYPQYPCVPIEQKSISFSPVNTKEIFHGIKCCIYFLF